MPNILKFISLESIILVVSFGNALVYLSAFGCISSIVNHQSYPFPRVLSLLLCESVVDEHPEFCDAAEFSVFGS